MRHGIDSLGIPSSLAPYWLPNGDPLAAMMAERQRLREQLERQAAQLATPQTAVDQRARAELLAPLLRPGWALSMSDFGGGGGAGVQGQAWLGPGAAPAVALPAQLPAGVARGEAPPAVRAW